MYDLIIIGAGPAGITAAVYAARKKINTLVVTGDIGGKPPGAGISRIIPVINLLPARN